MSIFLVTLVLMLLAVAGMAIGRLLGGTGIRGSCGSSVGVDGGEGCALCSRPCSRRRNSQP